MHPSREDIRDDVEAQFELPEMPPPMTKNRAKDFSCPRCPEECGECRRLRDLATKRQ